MFPRWCSTGQVKFGLFCVFGGGVVICVLCVLRSEGGLYAHLAEQPERTAYQKTSVFFSRDRVRCAQGFCSPVPCAGIASPDTATTATHDIMFALRHSVLLKLTPRPLLTGSTCGNYQSSLINTEQNGMLNPPPNDYPPPLGSDFTELIPPPFSG